MNTEKGCLDRRLEWLGAWSGIGWFVFAAAGFGGSGLIPVLSPATSPDELAAFVSDHKYQILIGMLLVLLGGYTFLITWSLTLAYQVRKYANPSPLAFYVMVLVGLNGGVISFVLAVLGSGMAFRVDRLDPATTQLLYDLMWFLFLIPWPPFMLWQFVVGFAILSVSNTQVMFPRWIGYFSLWAGALELFSMLSVFWYSGPFSYNGLVTFWVPGLSFFIWVFVFAVVQIKAWPRVKDRADDSAAAQRDGEPARSDSAEMPEAAQV